MFGCDKEDRIEIYLPDIQTTHFFSEIPTIVGWKLRQWNNKFLQYNVLPYSKAPFLISYPNRCFSPVSLWKWLHFLSSIQSYTYPWKLSRTKILTETCQTRDYALWNSFLILRCISFHFRFSNITVPPSYMNSTSVFRRQLFPSQSSTIRQIYERQKNKQILEFHDSSPFRQSLSFNSYMQRYEELNKVGEGMWSIAGNID